jgi:DNA-directed RNA polymerase specialized sigma24 family protein
MPDMRDPDSPNRVKRHLESLGPNGARDLSRRLVLAAYKFLRGTDKEKANDLAQKAFVLVFSGERVWNKNEQPDFVFFMIGVVKSLVWNDRKSVDNQRVDRRVTVVDSLDSVESEGVGNCIVAIETTSNPARIVEAERQIEYIRTRLNGLEKDGPLLAHLFSLTKIAGHSSEEAARELGLTTLQVYNLNKRLERALKPLYDPDTFAPPSDELTRKH